MPAARLTEAEAQAVRPALASASESARQTLRNWEDVSLMDDPEEEAERQQGAMIAYWRTRLNALAKLTVGLEREGA